ncbi:MAG: hypothetical protein IIX67_03320, partial [Clostridia bacterium]|nr:hypothetical protein [Clostridia bacterium]
GTRPEKNDDGTLKFPNWEDRAAAWGLINTIGAKLTLDGNTLTVEDDPEAPIEITNVALNKSYEISGIGERPEGYTGKVTDGIVPVGLGENKETEWFGFYHNGDRPTNAPDKVGYFIIDLEDEYALTSIRTHLINKDGWGVEIPEAVTAYVSLDGSAFEEVGSFEIDSTDGVEYWTEIEVDCNAKYVKVEFKLGGTFAFVSEIEVMGGKPGAAGDDEEPKEDIEAKMKELLGQAPADAKVDYVIEAPESYEAGDEITVTVTVKNITAENGIHVAAFKLLYDNEKLLLTNDLDEEDENALLCVKTLPKDWENLSSVANDYNADNEEGTVVNPLNDGVINVSVFTAKSSASAAIKEDGALVLEFTFKALEDAEGDIGLVIPHADAECAFNGKNGEEVYAANGSYAVIKAPVVEEESKPGDDPVEPGDASSMIIFVIIALVAIAGSAVVVKTRR